MRGLYKKPNWMVPFEEEEIARDAVRWLREHYEGNVKQAATKLNIPYSTVNSWFKGVSMPTKRRLRLIQGIRNEILSR